MLNLNHRLRSGKYAGQTVGYVYKKDRRYFNWIVENRPEMLRSHTGKKDQRAPQKSEEHTETPVKHVIKGISPSEAFD